MSRWLLYAQLYLCQWRTISLLTIMLHIRQTGNGFDWVINGATRTRGLEVVMICALGNIRIRAKRHDTIKRFSLSQLWIFFCLLRWCVYVAIIKETQPHFVHTIDAFTTYLLFYFIFLFFFFSLQIECPYQHFAIEFQVCFIILGSCLALQIIISSSVLDTITFFFVSVAIL